MGVFDRIQAHFKQSPSSSSSTALEEPLRGLVISSPAPPTAIQRARSDYFRFSDTVDAEEDSGVDGDGLPSYDHLFPNGPFRWFRNTSPIRPTRDIRRLKGKDTPAIPSSVIGIVCSRVLDPPTMAKLARLNHSIYEAVIPHLYRRITIDRFTLPKILYGIPLPISGFTFDPKAIFDAKGKQKQVYREEDVIPRSIEERKRKCLTSVKEIVLEEPLLDWRICQSLLILRDPGYVRDYSDSQPLRRYHPMREPEDPKITSSSRPIMETSILMPNVETVYLTAGVVTAMEQWEVKAKSPHILVDAIRALCGLKVNIVTSTPASDCRTEEKTVSNESGSEVTKPYNETFESGTWQPFRWP